MSQTNNRRGLRRLLPIALTICLAAGWAYLAIHANWSQNERAVSEGRP